MKKLPAQNCDNYCAEETEFKFKLIYIYIYIYIFTDGLCSPNYILDTYEIFQCLHSVKNIFVDLNVHIQMILINIGNVNIWTSLYIPLVSFNA